MKEVFPKATAFSTYATIIAVIYAFVRVIVPQLTDTAVIPRCSFPALDAEFSGSLRRATNHTEHVFRGLSNENMIFSFVMA
jgi:hypothetical protein